MSFAHGCVTGWLSPATLILQSKESPMTTGPIKIAELSWIGGVLPIGGIIGNLIYSVISKHYGSRIALLMLPLPNFVSKSLPYKICLLFKLMLIINSDILFVGNVWGHSFVFMCCSVDGWHNGGRFNCNSTNFCCWNFFRSVTEDVIINLQMHIFYVFIFSVRGSLGFLYTFFLNFGILCAFVLGSYLPYHLIPYIMVGLPVINCLCQIYFPESPTYLLLNKRLEVKIPF